MKNTGHRLSNLSPSHTRRWEDNVLFFSPLDMVTTSFLLIQRDFKPIDIKSAYVAPVKPKEEKRHRATQKLDDCTMNKHFFKRWEPQPPIRYGDFHESHTYVPPLSKFEGTTTTGDTYLGEPAPVPPCFFPKEQLGVTGGKVDFNTVYKSSFNQPNKIKGLTRHQATQLLHELRQRKEAMATGHFASNGIRAQWMWHVIS